MNALVTGAGGFVGGNLVRRLLNLDYQVTALSRSGRLDFSHDRLRTVAADITNASALTALFKDHDIVFHLAGTVAYSKTQSQKMVLNNVIGTSNVIEACRAARVPKLFYMSSVVAIGAGFTPDQILDETSPYNVSHLNLGYFETKHRAENLALEAHKKGDVEVFIANPSTIYGPGDAQKGSRSNQIKVAKGKMPFYTGGGVGVIQIEDLLDGCLAILDKGLSGERFILNSENITIYQLFKLIAEAAGQRSPFIYLPNMLLHGLGRIGDFKESRGHKFIINSETAWTSTLYHWFKNDKMKIKLGLNPRPAREAIASSVEWMKAQKVI